MSMEEGKLMERKSTSPNNNNSFDEFRDIESSQTNSGVKIESLHGTNPSSNYASTYCSPTSTMTDSISTAMAPQSRVVSMAPVTSMVCNSPMTPMTPGIKIESFHGTNPYSNHSNSQYLPTQPVSSSISGFMTPQTPVTFIAPMTSNPFMTTMAPMTPMTSMSSKVPMTHMAYRAPSIPMTTMSMSGVIAPQTHVTPITTMSSKVPMTNMVYKAPVIPMTTVALSGAMAQQPITTKAMSGVMSPQTHGRPMPFKTPFLSNATMTAMTSTAFKAPMTTMAPTTQGDYTKIGPNLEQSQSNESLPEDAFLSFDLESFNLDLLSNICQDSRQE